MTSQLVSVVTCVAVLYKSNGFAACVNTANDYRVVQEENTLC